MNIPSVHIQTEGGLFTYQCPHWNNCGSLDYIYSSLRRGKGERDYLVNLLTSQSDEHLISPYNTTADQTSRS